MRLRVTDQSVLDAIVDDESADSQVPHPVAIFFVQRRSTAGSLAIHDANHHLTDAFPQRQRTENGLRRPLFGSIGFWRGGADRRSHKPHGKDECNGGP